MELDTGDIAADSGPDAQAVDGELSSTENGTVADDGASVATADQGLLDGADQARHDTDAGRARDIYRSYRDGAAEASGSKNGDKRSDNASAIQTAAAMQLLPGTPAYQAASNNQLTMRGSNGQSVTFRQGDLYETARSRAARARAAGNATAAAMWGNLADFLDPANGPVTQEEFDQYLEREGIDRELLLSAEEDTQIEAQSMQEMSAADFDESDQNDVTVVETFATGDDAMSEASFFEMFESAGAQQQASLPLPPSPQTSTEPFATAASHASDSQLASEMDMDMDDPRTPHQSSQLTVQV